ncbi:MAG: primosomal protein N' family DNA-binding protein, partial [Flavobacteriales bacterium]
KYIEQVLDDKPIVLSFQLKFWKWLAKYYMCSLGEVLNVALPSGFKLSSETILHIHPSFEGDYKILNDKEYLVAEALE